jgi:hypothetical protein
VEERKFKKFHTLHNSSSWWEYKWLGENHASTEKEKVDIRIMSSLILGLRTYPFIPEQRYYCIDFIPHMTKPDT